MTIAQGYRDNPLVYLFSKTWQYSEGNRRNVVFYWILFILAESIDVFGMPIILSKMIGVVSTQGLNTESMKTLHFYLGLILLRVFVVWALHGPARVLELVNSFKIKINYRKYLLGGLFVLPLEWHTDHHSGDTIDKIEKGTTSLGEFSSDSFQFIYCFVRLFGCTAMLVYFSHSASYVVFIMMLASVWVTMRFDKILIKKYQQINKNENQVSESIFDAISNISTVIILRVERLLFDSIMRKVKEPLDLVINTSRLQETKWFIVSVCCTTMKILVLALFFYYNSGALPGTIVASLYILLNYLDKIGDLFFEFAGMYGYVVRRKTKVMNSEELSNDFISETLANHVLPKNWKSLEIKNLNFSYQGGEELELNLENLSFRVNHGERVALVGETGSGKSTFLKLMSDLYHPRSINLSVDGKSIPQGFEGISRAISLVPQNAEIFATTIFKNITLGAEHTLDFVRKFTDMACFTDVVEVLPNKFESSTKEKGVNLSGGQQQRLALSRGLLACHDKDIILLDEPTSSLDSETQVKVHANIFGEFEGKTIISSVHQLHLLPLFDRVCVFDKGKIIASGTIQELLISCPKFLSLWKAMQLASRESLSIT